MFKALSAISALIFMAVFVPVQAVALPEPAVKLSRSKICHPKGSESYNQTKNFTAFDTLEECLKEGRLRKGSDSGQTGQKTAASPQNPVSAKPYDREAFGGWADLDGNCMNTRHEVLMAMSTAAVDLKGRCAVVRGRWLDPYTGKLFTQASEVDIDHLVPVAYAWTRGADRWDNATRVRFYNDQANLFAVDRGANRDKGAKGLTEWLPPEEGFRCQYILRFQRVVLSYKLHQAEDEKAQIERLRRQYCKG